MVDHGAVRDLGDGRLEFTPEPDFEGDASFEYLAETDEDESARAHVTVHVTPDHEPFERSLFDLPEQPRALLVADFDADGRKV
jgi:hypothetical protein